MKRPLALILALFLASPLLFAQGNGVDNPPPAQSPNEKPDSTPTQPATATSAQGIPLIPQPQAPPVDSTAQDTRQKKKKPVLPSRTEAAEDAMQLHIKLRAAKTKALEDPAVKAERAKIELMKTDYDRREASKRYYVILYARMLQIDPSIAAGLATREAISLIRNYQSHITPTVPIDQVGQAKPTGPENAIAAEAGGGTPIPRRSFGQARIGSF